MVNNQCEVIICAGSGGVGKTTLSCAIAINKARQGKRVLVLTIDPAKRLASALGLEGSSLQTVKVPEQNYSGELYAKMIDPNTEFLQFISGGFKSQESANKLLNNRLFKQLSTSLSGSQEFTSINCLLEAVESKKYDLVILDTPPSQHALDFLGSPEKIYKLFQGRLIDWFVKPVEQQGFFRRVVNKGTETVLKVLYKITGSQFMDELASFFESVGEIKDKIKVCSQDGEALLLSPRTSFVLITSHGMVKLKEAENFIKELKSLNFNVNQIIINRAFPFYVEAQQQRKGELSAELTGLLHKIENYNSGRLENYKLFQRNIKAEVDTVLLPDYNEEVVGLKELENLGGFLQVHSGEK